MRAPSVKAESIRSTARARPAVAADARQVEDAAVERRQDDRKRRKGKERALDW